MTTRPVNRFTRALVAVFLALVATAVILIFLELPPDQRKEGLKGILFALAVVTAGLITIYRIGRAMEKEELEEEARETNEQTMNVPH